ncbi:cyclic nucleotide-binding protein, partial [Acinetobacter baumannii]|uniref:Crp/Fnr family transcriptional regulator n=1 Tax=Acinetobacter baumannii TaxID=470 RepID=UPI000DE69A8A
KVSTHPSQKLRYVFLEQIAIQTRSISQRLAQRLLFILEGYGNHILIQDHQIQISQEQLANMLTTSRQTINHELSLLEKQNIIKIAFRKIEILDIEKLKVIAQFHS